MDSRPHRSELKIIKFKIVVPKYIHTSVVSIDGYVEVGKEGDQAFLTWQDPSPTDIKYFSATSKPAGVFKFYYNCEDSTLPSYSSTGR